MLKPWQKKRYIKEIAALTAVVLTFSACSGNVPITTRIYSSGLGNVTRAVTQGSKVILTVDNGSKPSDDLLTLEVCKSDVMRVDYQPNSAEASPNTPMIDPNLSWNETPAAINAQSDPITIQTDAMKIEIAKNPCRMTVKKADGTTLFWEPSTGGVNNDGVRFVRASATNMYGIHGYDCFSGNGELLRNDSSTASTAGQQGNSGGPFMWSTAGYGFLVDSDGGHLYTSSKDKKIEFYYGGTPTEGRRYSKTDVEYYIMLGEPKEIMKSYSKITGTSPMMPKWSLGFSNFEWGINESELTSMVDTYRAKNIPLDGYALDYDWKQYGNDNYGEFAWNTTNFPSASTTALKDAMNAKGVKLIGIMKPRIVTNLSDGTQTVQGTDATAGGFFYPGHNEYRDYFLPVTVRSVDLYKANQRKWWWQHSQDAFNKGIVGWWNDEADKVSFGPTQYWFGNFTTLHLSQAMYEGQKAYTNGQTRVWQISRNFYPGTQRYATGLWSGDVGIQFYKGEHISRMAGLNEQKADLLSTVNNGQVKWGTDGGGFQNSDSAENPSPELYTRWIQLASVSPIFRVHGTDHQQRQPWFFGHTAEEVSKAAIQLRYSLLPYLYSYEREAYDTGLGLVRPLLFDYPNDTQVKNYSDAWMLGDWLLVAPITERNQSCKRIYLPAGNWIDYNRGTTYTGGQYISYMVNSESWTDLPMFIKEGAILPSQEVLEYVGQKTVSKVNVDIFPSSQKTSFRYYDDDGESYQYEGNNILQQTISVQSGKQDVSLYIEPKTGTYSNGVQYYYLAVHGKPASSVVENGTALQNCSDYNALLAANGSAWSVGKDIYGDVTYIKTCAGSKTAKNIVLSGNAPTTDTEKKYEAEYASLSGKTTAARASVNNSHSGYSGSGFVDKFESNQAAATFYAKVADVGNYGVTLRYANGSTSPKSISLYVNGKYACKADLPSTASWDAWADAAVSLPLAAGNNSITVKKDTATGDSGFIYLDYIKVPFALCG
jgi:alpha-glucosidase (family GH31 glycosyl hydrolase)